MLTSAARRARSAATERFRNGRERAALRVEQGEDSTLGKTQQNVELFAGEGIALGSSLKLDEPAGIGHRHVHVDFGPAVLLVRKVEDRDAVDDPDRDGADLARQRPLLLLLLVEAFPPR